jgi:hypothetical protein
MSYKKSYKKSQEEIMNEIVREEQDVFSLGKVFAASGYFQDARDAAQATVKILAGRELGLPPFASMTGIHIIKGKPTMGASLIAARIKASGKYNYRVVEMSDQVCRIAFFEQGDQIGVSEFTLADARKAGTQNLDKFPRNMLFARAISNGAKWYCPDLFITGVYVPEEMGARVDAEGEVVSMPAPEQSPAPPQKRAEKPPLNRDAALARIAELGGDVAYAETLSDDALVAYGKALKSLPEEQQAAVSDGEGVSVVGVVEGKPFVNEKVCKFTLMTDDGSPIPVAVFPQNEGVWHLLVNGEREFTAGGDGLRVEGKWSVKDGYDPSIIAQKVFFE